MEADKYTRAFPLMVNEPNESGGTTTTQHMGLTMRDYFAIRILPEIVNSRSDETVPKGRDPDEVRREFRAECAAMSYDYADAMLKAREA